MNDQIPVQFFRLLVSGVSVQVSAIRVFRTET